MTNAQSEMFDAVHVCPQERFLLHSVRQLSCTAESAPPAAPDAIACGDASAQLLAQQVSHASRLPRPQRVAVCFYSLTRSLQQTVHSIDQNVLTPLNRAGTSFDVFVHTYNLSRSGCTGCSGALLLDWRADVAALATVLPSSARLHVQVDDQSRLMRRFAAQFTHAFKTEWRADGKATGVAQFYLAAMHSLKRVTAMWQQHGPYRTVFMLRPDLVYLDPMPVGALLANTSTEWLAVSPRLFKRGKWVDDKFAIGTPRAAVLYGNRIDALMSFMDRHPGRLSESYLGWYLHTLRACITISPLPRPSRILRVRSSAAVSCKDLHHEYGLNLQCERCHRGRQVDAAERERVQTELWVRAQLAPHVSDVCFRIR